MFYCLRLWFDTWYAIKEGKLEYRSGPFRDVIEVDRIKTITFSKSIMSGFRPALGFHGMIIRYDRWNNIYIAPKDREEMTAELVKINGEIEVVRHDN
ncbi:PH domain-containing protein [Hufsiella ginkgonis]|uniref:Uncharacterized protein YyaB-like PH domain-containing protein n=1 Tax=Hufsiella ginkgonis TaxID=2695274 RepID=A0A7K1XX78_9SPHI|nr:PH domain-containing protein [Hufsiella ginkgonis]MXV15614.1 hypothetical protein [Hufsiella ginkgonis]